MTGPLTGLHALVTGAGRGIGAVIARTLAGAGADVTLLGRSRADLCALARPHLSNPAWTLSAAAEQQFSGQIWPNPYLSGKSQLERNFERAAQAVGPV